MLTGLFKIVTGLFRHESVGDSLSGPVGIFKLTEFYGSLGWRYLMQFIGLLSANLALVNLLPIPALDGGRLVFVLYEIVTKKRPPVHFERLAHTLGFVLLLVFIVFISFQDIKRFF